MDRLCRRRLRRVTDPENRIITSHCYEKTQKRAGRLTSGSLFLLAGETIATCDGSRKYPIAMVVVLGYPLYNDAIEKKRHYLLCPQCGTHRFFVIDEKGEPVYFHVDWNKEPFPTQASNAHLSGRDFSVIHSTGCTWKGGLERLVKYLR